MQGFMCGGGKFGDYGASRKHVKSQAKVGYILCAAQSLGVLMSWIYAISALYNHVVHVPHSRVWSKCLLEIRATGTFCCAKRFGGISPNSMAEGDTCESALFFLFEFPLGRVPSLCRKTLVTR